MYSMLIDVTLNLPAPYSKVNPSDCVDMDCDGLKKAFVFDKDGSLMPSGQPGTIFAYSEFAWDAMDRDRARGTGDYRIPRTMLTMPDSTRIPINSFASFVGRGL